MMLFKLDTRQIHGSIAIALITFSLFVTIVNIVPTNAQGSNNTLPLVAIHVSENTESIWSTLLPAHPHSDWAYFAIYESLEEVLRSDGTPFVEVNDSLIESGGLLNSGEPKYPILISLAAECISDSAASQILQYVSSGGFAYVGSSAWTRYSNGTARSNFALSAEMGVKCDNTTGSLNYWNTLTYIYKNATNRLVDILPAGVNISPWNLPLDNGTSIQNTGAGNAHYFWQARNTATNPADVFLTVPLSPSPYIMLATKAYSNGRFIYHSELTPMIGFSIYAPQMYEYSFFRKAIEWAFESRSLPLTRLNAWPYQYDSAFIIRHDCDSGSSFVLGSAQREKQLGVTGQYYLMTGPLLDDPNNASYITQLQQAQNLYGAQIGPHNGGLNSHYWLGTLPGDYAYYHWGPDICIVRNGTGDYWPYNSTSQQNPGHGAVPTNLYGKDYANMSIGIALDNLTTWLGQRPVIWVSPWADSSRDDSLEILESQGIESAGERNFGPFPHVALSLNTKGKYYEIIEFPSQPWATSSGAVYQRLEEHSYGTGGTMQQMIDFLYSMGAMVNMYGHVSSSGGVGEAYINYSKSKPNMWNATPTLIRDWWLQRNPVSINPVYQLLPDGTRNLTITATGSTSLDTTVEIAFPVSSLNQIYGLQVLLDGVPTSNYRTPGTGAKAIKVKAGLASNITVTYKQLTLWTQTSQADFESGTLTNLDTSSVPGQVSLAVQSGGGTLFYDYFNDSSWTSSNWTVQSGTWTTGLYIQNNTGANYVYSYAGDTSWSNYTVEARTGGTSGSYFAQIGARLNPATGAHYSLWLYPSTGGPNIIKLLKFSNWATWTLVGTQAAVATDTNYHTLKMTLNGSSIRCYYDGASVINGTDSAYSTGLIDFETYATVAKYDWVTVTNMTDSTTLFSDDFNNATWTNSRWTVYAGTWSVEVEKYLQSDMTSSTLSGYKYSHAGDTAWTNYVVEASARYMAGGYGAQIGARLNPSTGAHYAFWIYPSAEGPNLAKLLKFSDWTHWTLLASATNLTTNTNWHILKMVLNGASISCYYDGNPIIQVTDSGYASGKIDLETAIATVEYDWITVKQPSSYYSSGTLVSSPFDTGFKAQWMNVSWTASLQGGTEVKLRTRTASTQSGLASAAWSDYYTVSGAAITSPANRWVQYEATLSTSNTFVTPILYDVTISYMELSKHDLTIAASGYGTTDPTPGVYSIYEGEQQMVTAYPDTGYTLDYWDLDGTNMGNSLSYTVTMDNDYTLTAHFIELLPTQYGLLVEVSGSGTTNATGTNMYDPDTVVYVEAFPASSWAFSHWLRNDTDVGSSNPIEITMTENVNLTAVFTTTQHTLTIVASGSGTTDPVPGVYLLDEGSSQTVTAIPDSGFVLGHWDLDGTYVGDDSSFNVTIDAYHTLTAVFVMRAHVYVDPPLTEKTAEAVYSTFRVNVTIEKVQDLWGFDFNLTWDDTITTLASTDFNSSLDEIWGHNDWYVAFTETGTGYYELAAVSTSGGYSTTTPITLIVMEFYVKNTPGETAIHLAMVKLSNSFWRQIKRDQTDGVYRFIGPAYRPIVQMNPTTATCRKSEETFEVQINVTNALRVQGFNFEIHYNASLINYVSVTWGNLGTGTITIVDNQNGVLAGNVAGPTLSQNLWLLNITFKVNQTMIWHAGAPNRLDGEIWFHDVILYFSGGSQLQREEGGINQIDTQTASYSFMPIQGDVDNNGTVNVFDLRTVATYYDVASIDPEWTVASKFDLNGDLTIDIYDLVVVGANFGFAY